MWCFLSFGWPSSGAGISAPLGVRAAHIGLTAQCIITAIPNDIEAAVIVPLINDTTVFLAISYRILVHTLVADSFMARLRVFMGGKGPSALSQALLPALSQALLRSGQHFYLVAVATNITLLTAFRLSPVIHGMLTIPAFALINAMACLVFRKIKFGLITSDGISKISTINIPSNLHATADSRSLPLHFRHTDPATAEFGTNSASVLDIAVQTETDKFEDGADASMSEGGDV
ncbi:hypothetical protein MSAN_02381800 [Mycena sanguinolenta]|uniref:Uncharacterized protein n=1 Tax=Mycena sanguinolenta TaxID=230812 RepID=A0A8H6X4Y0_9AGAR|nr:hypothetical protein MSAN_02381800 [Mycena sanguinolenta]